MHKNYRFGDFDRKEGSQKIVTMSYKKKNQSNTKINATIIETW